MNTEELNQFIRELNASSRKFAETPDSPESFELPQMEVESTLDPASRALIFPESEEQADRLHMYLAKAVARGGTDLLLVPGAPPTIRVHGQLVPLDPRILNAGDAAEFLLPSLSPERRRRFAEGGDVDLALSVPQLGRFRINLHLTRHGSAAAFRLLPRNIPTTTELGLPRALEELTKLVRGLILVTGPSGCGKSTTLAALINAINQRDQRHIVTIEDPVEYEHKHQQSIVEQIEIGSDAKTFAQALRASLRQDPDVILVGEMRDLDTVQTVLTAAETGHLVLTTVHTNDAAQTVHRIVDVFPSDQQPQIRQQLAMSLSCIVYQQLLMQKDGAGRALACEVLIANDAVRNHIRKGALHHLHSEMTLGRKLGMITLENSLAQLVRSGTITEAEARAHSIHTDELSTFLKE